MSKSRRQYLYEWELEIGIEIVIKNKSLYITKHQFEWLIRQNYIVIKTEKGLEFLNNM